MKKINFLLSSILLISFLTSCNDKKLTEVVEVPLPTAQEKVTIGFPEDVKLRKDLFKSKNCLMGMMH